VGTLWSLGPSFEDAEDKNEILETMRNTQNPKLNLNYKQCLVAAPVRTAHMCVCLGL